MKKYLICAALLMLLSACSSAGNLRNSAPTAVYAGDTSAEQVTSCVSSAWAKKHYQVTAVPLLSGTSLQIQDTATSPVLALVDIVPTGAKTVAKYYSRMVDDDSWFFGQVKDCM